MNKYVPKVGDKVRATLGESVLVGEVASTHGGDITVSVGQHNDGSSVFAAINPRRWHFEQVVSVPTKFGAVIRRADGQVYSYTALRQKSCPWLGDDSDGWVSERYATQGGFTVLFEGVDE